MKKIVLSAICLASIQQMAAQNELPTPENYTRYKAITTGVPFLNIAADARSAGMGDMGVATSADVFSQQHNAAKYAFAEKSQGFAISYTPYMSKISTDISLAQLNYYNRFNERNAVGASLRYFGLGDVQFTDLQGNDMGVYSPNEFAFDVTYTIKLTDRFAGAVTGRYISSNLQLGTESEGKANSIAVDLSGYYESGLIMSGNSEGRFKAGFAIQNLGPKISYTDDGLGESFLPTNLRLGAGYDFIMDQYNTISVYGEVTKLLVPTPQEPKWLDLNNDGELSNDEYRLAMQKSREEYQNIGWLKGVGKSFGDAPGGFGEEMKEFTWALGAEYWYQDSFAFRAGYFHESEEKGSRQFATLGAGFKYNTVKVDVSYLFGTGKIQNPLDSTLRFSLTFNFGDNYYRN